MAVYGDLRVSAGRFLQYPVIGLKDIVKVSVRHVDPERFEFDHPLIRRFREKVIVARDIIKGRTAELPIDDLAALEVTRMQEDVESLRSAPGMMHVEPMRLVHGIGDVGSLWSAPDMERFGAARLPQRGLRVLQVLLRILLIVIIMQVADRTPVLRILMEMLLSRFSSAGSVQPVQFSRFSQISSVGSVQSIRFRQRHSSRSEIMERSALPRWLIAFFSSSVISALVLPYSGR